MRPMNNAIDTWFQLTHPWGCDLVKFRNTNQIGISTHTPVRVWLKRWKKSARLWVISTHTPVRVWLCLLDPYNLKYAHFNSHTREGVTVNLCNIKIKFAISTHTPVRVWLTGIKKAVGTYKFQLTHPWGCDVSADAGITASWNFNSHTREGVTCLSPFIFSRLVISTHTPVRVWQDQNYYSYYHCAISTHTPVRVWQDQNYYSYYHCAISTHTPVRVWHIHNVVITLTHTISTHTPVRVWLIHLVTVAGDISFQLTHPWGCDDKGVKKSWKTLKFQLTHPWGCDATNKRVNALFGNFNSHTREGVT